MGKKRCRDEQDEKTRSRKFKIPVPGWRSSPMRRDGARTCSASLSSPTVPRPATAAVSSRWSYVDNRFRPGATALTDSSREGGGGARGGGKGGGGRRSDTLPARPPVSRSRLFEPASEGSCEKDLRRWKKLKKGVRSCGGRQRETSSRLLKQRYDRMVFGDETARSTNQVTECHATCSGYPAHDGLSSRPPGDPVKAEKASCRQIPSPLPCSTYPLHPHFINRKTAEDRFWSSETTDFEL
ncbi:hypothetical protein GN956_G19521 [Arapaima gigas]